MSNYRSKTFMLHVEDYEDLGEYEDEELGMVFRAIYQFMNGENADEVFTEYDDINYFIKRMIKTHMAEKKEYLNRTLEKDRKIFK